MNKKLAAQVAPSEKEIRLTYCLMAMVNETPIIRFAPTFDIESLCPNKKDAKWYITGVDRKIGLHVTSEEPDARSTYVNFSDVVLEEDLDELPIGCIIDGNRGIYVGKHVLSLAASYGWRGEQSKPEDEYHDEDVEEASAYLERFTPEGHWVGFYEGSFGVWEEDPHEELSHREMEARAELNNQGWIVSKLWHVEDAKVFSPEITDAEAREVVGNVINSEATTNQFNEEIEREVERVVAAKYADCGSPEKEAEFQAKFEKYKAARGTAAYDESEGRIL